MEKNIVKNGARVISFAPDDESANIWIRKIKNSSLGCNLTGVLFINK